MNENMDGRIAQLEHSLRCCQDDRDDWRAKAEALDRDLKRVRELLFVVERSLYQANDPMWILSEAEKTMRPDGNSGFRVTGISFNHGVTVEFENDTMDAPDMDFECLADAYAVIDERRKNGG